MITIEVRSRSSGSSESKYRRCCFESKRDIQFHSMDCPSNDLSPNYNKLYLSHLKQYRRPLSTHFKDEWQWNPNDKSESVKIAENNCRIACIHIGWSNGTSGVRGTKPINIYPKGKYYWEVLLKDKVFGTSMMIGLTTSKARLHSDSYINLIGENRFGWGLSHKGLLWHNGHWKEYTEAFTENQSTLIGVLYDGSKGTLTYYKDGECLGVAFSGLNQIKENLYPTISSTAAQSQFVITMIRREYFSLQDRCRDIIRRNWNFDPFDITMRNRWLQIFPERVMSFLTFEEEYFEAKRRETRMKTLKYLKNNHYQNHYYHHYHEQYNSSRHLPKISIYL